MGGVDRCGALSRLLHEAKFRLGLGRGAVEAFQLPYHHQHQHQHLQRFQKNTSYAGPKPLKLPNSLRKMQKWSSFSSWVANVPKTFHLQGSAIYIPITPLQSSQREEGSRPAVVGNGILPIVKMLSIHRRVEGCPCGGWLGPVCYHHATIIDCYQ